jgi:putative membrane protein
VEVEQSSEASHPWSVTAEAHVDARSVIKGAMIGAAAGLAASWTMSKFDSAWKAAADEAHRADEPNTVKAADAVATATLGKPVPNGYREPTGTAVHYGFGAFLGALYGAVVELRPATSAGFGTAYGVAVSLVADEIAMPVLGFSPPATEVAAPTHLRGFVSHLAFGVSLEAVRRLLTRSLREPIN